MAHASAHNSAAQSSNFGPSIHGGPKDLNGDEKGPTKDLPDKNNQIQNLADKKKNSNQDLGPDMNDAEEISSPTASNLRFLM